MNILGFFCFPNRSYGSLIYSYLALERIVSNLRYSSSIPKLKKDLKAVKMFGKVVLVMDEFLIGKEKCLVTILICYYV